MPDETVPQSSPETVEDFDIRQLPEALGFVENDLLANLREEINAALAADDQAKAEELVLSYSSAGEKIVDGPPYIARVHLGFDVAMAVLRNDIGQTDNYPGQLQDAFNFAHNTAFNHPENPWLLRASVIINTTLERVRAETKASGKATEEAIPADNQDIIDILRSLREEGVDFEEEDVEHIMEMDRSLAINYLATALDDADHDPVTKLQELGLIE